MKTKKIIHLVRYFYPHIGGNENQALGLVRALTRETCYSYSILTYRYDSHLVKQELIDDILVFRVSFFCNFISLLRRFLIKNHFSIFYKILNRVIFYITELDVYLSMFIFLKRTKSDIDVIHVHQATTVALVAATIAKRYYIPVFVKDATTDGLDFFKMFPFGNYMMKYIISGVNFISMTKIIKSKLLERGIDVKYIHDIPNGIDVTTFESEMSYARNREILFIGNYDQGEIKGLDVLVHAFILVQGKYSDASLTIVGRGDPDAYIKFFEANQIDSSKYKFVGESLNPKMLFSSHNVFVLPSRAEGFSNSLIEALYSGIPCVATNVSGVQEMIKDGFNGKIVDVSNEVELANSIVYCFENQEEISLWGARSRNKIIESFSFSKVAKSCEQMYDSSLSCSKK